MNAATLQTILDKPLPADDSEIGWPDRFNPWSDIFPHIYGGYSSESDRLMIETLEAVRDRTTFALIDKHGFIIEFMLYVLAGHGLTEYGTSPRGGFPDLDIADQWQPLIDKWTAYAAVAWSDS